MKKKLTAGQKKETQLHYFKRMWCFACGVWVKPIEKIGSPICPNCRSRVYDSPGKDETND